MRSPLHRSALTAVAVAVPSVWFAYLAACGTPTHSVGTETCADGVTELIQASNYDQSCKTASDCIAVGEGNACYPCEIVCTNAAINASARAAYEADVAKTGAGSDPSVMCGCPAEFTPCCRAGTCHADSECENPGPQGDAEPEGSFLDKETGVATSPASACPWPTFDGPDPPNQCLAARAFVLCTAKNGSSETCLTDGGTECPGSQSTGVGSEDSGSHAVDSGPLECHDTCDADEYAVRCPVFPAPPGVTAVPWKGPPSNCRVETEGADPEFETFCCPCGS